MRWLRLCLISLLLGGCVQAQYGPGGNVSPFDVKLSRSSLTNAEYGRLLYFVRSILKDPKSLRIGEHYVAATPYGSKLVCFVFDSKNSFGAYTGMSASIFELYEGQFRLIANPGSSRDNARVAIECVRIRSA